MKKIIFSLVLLFGLVTDVSAATRDELQAQLNVLLAQMAQLQQSSSTATTTLPVFVPGVRVSATDTVRVRSSYGLLGSLVGLQAPGMTGVIQSGPFSSGGYRWVNVNFGAGADGWVTTSWLAVVPVTPTSTAAWTVDDVVAMQVSDSATVAARAYTFSFADNSEQVVTVPVGATTSAQVAALTAAGFSGDGEVVLALLNSGVVTSATTSYVVADILRVKTIAVDPKVERADDEFRLYRVVLRDEERWVVVPVMADEKVIANAFARSGLRGDAATVINWAPTDNDRIQHIRISGTEVKLDAVVSLASDKLFTVCGPMSFGTVVWGDATDDAVYGLGCSATTQTISMSHVYSKAGTYTVTLRDVAGNETVAVVEIK